MADRLAAARVDLVPLTTADVRRMAAGDFTGIVCAPGWPHADTLDGFAFFAAHAQPGEVGPWLVVRRTDGAVIGDVGWKGPPDADGRVEIGYGLAASARGQGYAAEAVTALLDWIGGQPGVRRVVAEVLADNAPSRRLLERLGFALDEQSGGYLYYRLDLG